VSSFEPAAREDRPFAPADPRGQRVLDELHERVEDLKARTTELDAVAWSQPARRHVFLPPDDAWPVNPEDRSGSAA
jgi:hypothetical protein